MSVPVPRAAVALLTLALLPACSVKGLAINALGNALAEGGSSYARDDDPELAWEAVPFGLKTVEGLLEEAPRHKGLLFAAASGFTQYGYGRVQQEADFVEATDLARATELRTRARQALPARARATASAAWRWTSPGSRDRLRKDGARRPGPHAQGARAPALLDGARLVRRHRPLQGRLRADRGPGPGGGAHAPRARPGRGLRAAAPSTTSSSRGRAAGESVGGSFERARQHLERAQELAGGQRACPPTSTSRRRSPWRARTVRSSSACCARPWPSTPTPCPTCACRTSSTRSGRGGCSGRARRAVRGMSESGGGPAGSRQP